MKAFLKLLDICYIFVLFRSINSAVTHIERLQNVYDTVNSEFLKLRGTGLSNDAVKADVLRGRLSKIQNQIESAQSFYLKLQSKLLDDQ